MTLRVASGLTCQRSLKGSIAQRTHPRGRLSYSAWGSGAGIPRRAIPPDRSAAPDSDNHGRISDDAASSATLRDTFAAQVAQDARRAPEPDRPLHSISTRSTPLIRRYGIGPSLRDSDTQGSAAPALPSRHSSPFAVSPLDSADHNHPQWGQLTRRSSPTGLGRSFPEQKPKVSLGRSGSALVANHNGPVASKLNSTNDFWSTTRGRMASLRQGQKPPQTVATDSVASQTTASEDTRPGRRRDNRLNQSDTRNWTEEILERPRQSTLTPTSSEALPNPSTEPVATHLTHEEYGKGRRGRERETKVKPSKKPKPRRRNYEMDEDDDFDEAAEARALERRRRKEERKREEQTGPTPILLPELISVSNLGSALGVKVDPFLEQLSELGFEDITQDSIMSGETAALVAQEYGFDPTVEAGEAVDLKPRPPPEDPSTLPPRPPIVTIMGHVDHGKTTLLDWLRKSSVAAHEHGGITQHIGAFSVALSAGKQITFLDTPGHAAFLTMRQRGANVTDIVVLVVAADDSVKPQTLEALKHARAAKVPIIVAINKIDKDEARIDQVKADLSARGVEIEDYGGDVQVACVSGKTGQGMQDLEESILTLSEILDMRAEVDGMAEGWVLESSIKPIGRVATVLIKRGILRRGDTIVAGSVWARVRIMRNEAGIEIEEAPPGTPVEILGWKEPPLAGDMVLQAPDEARAKAAARYRHEIQDRERSAAEFAAQEKRGREKTQQQAAQEAGEEAEPSQDAADTEQAETGPTIVNFAVLGDVMGSVEAVCSAVMEVGSHEVRPRILRSRAGQISEFDIEHAATSNSTIINFNNAIPGMIKAMADRAGVRILDHTIIYHVADDVKATLSKLLKPLVTARVLGEAEILQIFPINVRGRVYKNIAGCRIRNGRVARSDLYRVFRKGEKILDGMYRAKPCSETTVLTSISRRPP